MSVCGSVFEAERCLAFWKKLWYDKNEEECVEGSVDGVIRIAVVDDEKDQIFQLKKIIQSFFHEKGKSIMVSCFTQGEELLTQSTDFDMIFLDIQMEGIDGIETARLIRQKNKKVALIYVSNYSEQMAASFAVHPFSFLEKPIQNSKIREVPPYEKRYQFDVPFSPVTAKIYVIAEYDANQKPYATMLFAEEY